MASPCGFLLQRNARRGDARGRIRLAGSCPRVCRPAIAKLRSPLDVSCQRRSYGTHSVLQSPSPDHRAPPPRARPGDNGTAPPTRSPDTEMTRAPSAQTPHRIALLFNANKVYDREIISGIGQYLHTTRVVWDLFLEDDFRCRLTGIERFDGDGIIADFDDPAVADALAGSPLPIVAIGSSYEDPTQYPDGVPYIATDNPKLVSLAYTHLIGAGLAHFAMYSLPVAQENRWAQQRELAFDRLARADGLDAPIYRGLSTSASGWNHAIEQLIGWLHALPKPSA
ncbi:hypothetical protein [Burkholderia cenocepacia]|uniref:hypothetical protein n=1 Tax=Burkholderia cenocepacia TaxID=95486 RepID=UPI003BFA73EC